MSVLLRSIVLCLCLPAAISLAESRPHINAFFGFEVFLTPIAIKWSCGGQSEQDLAAIDMLISENRKDAEEAELGIIVALLLDVSKRQDGVDEILGFETTQDQREDLCAAVLPLGISDLMPRHLAGQTDDDLALELKTKWTPFYKVVEDIHTKTSP